MVVCISGCSAEPFHLAALINQSDTTNGTKHDLIHRLANKPIKHWQELHCKERIITSPLREDDLCREKLGIVGFLPGHNNWQLTVCTMLRTLECKAV